jgi:hypothetical protein
MAVKGSVSLKNREFAQTVTHPDWYQKVALARKIGCARKAQRLSPPERKRQYPSQFGHVRAKPKTPA